MPLEQGSQRRTECSIAGVAAEDQDGETRRGSGPCKEPGAEAQPVGREEGDRLAIRETDFVK